MPPIMCFHLSLYEALKPNYFNLLFTLMKRAGVVVSVSSGGDLKCRQAEPPDGGGFWTLAARQTYLNMSAVLKQTFSLFMGLNCYH